MKLQELLEKKYIEKIEDNLYRCLKCNKTFKKLGVINHHFYEHEENGIQKKEILRKKAVENNNKPEMRLKISIKTKEAHKRDTVKKNFEQFVIREKTERKGKGNPMYGKSHTEEWKKNHSKQMTGFKHLDITKEKMRIANTGKKHELKSIEKMRIAKLGKRASFETKLKMSKSRQNKHYNKLTISKIKKKYPFFSKIEEMRYNPDKSDEKEIQVHCKNHLCKNSKEQGGWFTPDIRFLKYRIYALEKVGDYNGLYCSEECKESCPIYGVNPINNINQNNINISYTESEYQTFRKFVLKRDNYICQFCGKKATHVHHERPQKLEPFFALDPDFAWSCCEKCHYEKGHKDECSTGKLANKVCGGKEKDNDSI